MLTAFITHHIINEFVKRQKPILSVHDSYIVDTRDVELLRDLYEGS
jgi:hypothetical protein